MQSKVIYRYPILIIDDDIDSLNHFDLYLQKAGFDKITTSNDSRKAKDLLKNQDFELVLLDLSMPHISGEELLKYITDEYPRIPVLIITGTNEAEKAVECLRLGAFDYLVKPVEKNRLILSVRKAVDFRELKLENERLKHQVLHEQLEEPKSFENIITNDPAMYSIFQYIEAIAPNNQPVLITGETGAGKELIARALHDKSGMKGTFIAVNVAGLDDHTFSDTLFGHLKGSFTGAINSREGLVASASGGTLFLDEIGDLGFSSQVKLLRLIQEMEFFPIGSDNPISSTCRILVATNKELPELEDSTHFRKDLYYRLCVHHINLPPLRERILDIPLLVEHFMTFARENLEEPELELEHGCIPILTGYSFPGNVRELFAIIMDAASRAQESLISLSVLQEVMRHKNREGGDNTSIEPSLPAFNPELPVSEVVTFPENLPTLKEIENLLVSEALKRTDNNQSRAAQQLGISRQALNKRIKNEKEKS